MGGAATTRCRSGRWRPSAPSSAAESPRHSPDAESPRKLFDPLREASIGSPAQIFVRCTRGLDPQGLGRAIDSGRSRCDGPPGAGQRGLDKRQPDTTGELLPSLLGPNREGTARAAMATWVASSPFSAPSFTNAAASFWQRLAVARRNPVDTPGSSTQQRLTRVLPRGSLAGSACPRAGHFSFGSLA